MAVIDDLNRLAAQDVVYLSRNLSGPGLSASQVYRGRLRQALLGDWVFNASTGQNGVVGLMLGGVTPNWTSGETPVGGIRVIITTTIIAGNPPLNEIINLTTLIPTDFTE